MNKHRNEFSIAKVYKCEIIDYPTSPERAIFIDLYRTSASRWISTQEFKRCFRIIEKCK